MEKEDRFPMLVFLIVALISLLALTAHFDRLDQMAGKMVYDILSKFLP